MFDRRTPSRLLRPRLLRTQISALLLISAATMLLNGCGNFFSCEGKASCPTTTTTTTTTSSTGSGSTDYVYLSNSATGNTYVDGYGLSTGALVAATGSPYQFDYIPSAMAVTPSDTFLYASSDSSTGAVYGYSISSTTGALSSLDSGTALLNDNVAAMAVSPDGQWLFVLDAAANEIEEYSIDSSTGGLTFATSYVLTGSANGTVSPVALAVAPSGDYFACALETGGADVFSFDTTTGTGAETEVLSPANAATGIYAVAIDGNNYLYTAGTAGLQVFSVTDAGIATPLQTYATGVGAKSVVVDSTSTYVYVGNQSDSTITGYTIGSSGVLTAIAGSPFTGPTDVSALGRDSTNAYIIASGYNSSTGIQLFSIGSGGALSLLGSAGSGITTPSVPAILAATH